MSDAATLSEIVRPIQVGPRTSPHLIEQSRPISGAPRMRNVPARPHIADQQAGNSNALLKERESLGRVRRNAVSAHFAIVLALISSPWASRRPLPVRRMPIPRAANHRAFSGVDRRRFFTKHAVQCPTEFANLFRARTHRPTLHWSPTINLQRPSFCDSAERFPSATIPRVPTLFVPDITDLLCSSTWRWVRLRPGR